MRRTTACLQRLIRRGVAAVACACALGCDSTDEERPRSCLGEECRGSALEVTRLGSHGAVLVVDTVHAATTGLVCSPVRIRGSVRCVPAGSDCGFGSIEEAESARANVERALTSLHADGGVEEGGETLVTVDDCACRTYVERPCPG